MHCRKTVATLEHQFEKLYSKIRDEEPDSLVSQVTRCYSKCGEKSVTGRLKGVGILVQQERSERILATSRSKWWCVTLCNSPSPSSLRRSFTKCLVAYRRIP